MSLQVKYWHRCEEWHPKSCPDVYDENGPVATMHQNVGHPGEYDEKADRLATLFAASEDLLAACVLALTSMIEIYNCPDGATARTLREAIAKARGYEA